MIGIVFKRVVDRDQGLVFFPHFRKTLKKKDTDKEYFKLIQDFGTLTPWANHAILKKKIRIKSHCYN